MLATLLLTALQLVAGQSSTNSSGLVVGTNVGTYQGFFSSSTVRAWYGIRFGQPTNGTRRFKPPTRAAVIPAGTVYNASSFADNCPQLDEPLTYGEDCLGLNIWAPSLNRTNSSSSGATVMIWIYGGGYTEGSASINTYLGNNFVRDQSDIIVVSINYRVSVYGFPAGSGANPYELNPGFQDQRLAVEWVYENIRNFGGDPSKITLFGESAGAASIGAYAYAYSEDPIARGFIMESGSEYLNQPITVAEGNSASQQSWQAVAAKVGCNSSTQTQASQFSCMQQVNITTLVNAVNNVSTSGTSFLPTQDGVLLLNSTAYTAAAQAGQFANVPVLLGTNNNEGTSLVASYAGGDAAAANGITVASFTCPAAEVAEQRQNASVPVWQYRYFGTWPDVTPPNSTLYAFHGSEIPIVFGNYNQTTTYPASRAEVLTSQTMQAAWAAFAKDPVQGLTNYGWPQYQANGTTLIEIAKNYYNQSMSVLSAAAYPVVTFNSSQAYNYVC